MQAQCPYCQTIFRITAAHLNVAQGHVRCGQCQNIFDATKYLVREGQQHVPSSVVAVPKETPFSKEMEDSEFFQEEEEIEERSRSLGKLFFWTVIAFFLAGVLGMQTVWFLKQDLILQDVRLRPWLERFCYTFLCRLPDTRDVNSFHIQEAVVKVHPDISDVIEIDMNFANGAPFPQPYPEVQVTFQNNHETPLAQRRFQPSEYLPISSGKIMRAGAIVHFQLKLKDTLNIIDNGKLVVGYTFEFL